MSTTSSRPFVDYALAYARRGWRVFPLHEIHSGDCSCGRDTCASAGKHPRTKNGVKDATTDQAQIRAWWSQWPTANIGIATGIAEGQKYGLFVIDVDAHKGANVDDLRDCDLSTLLESLIASTGSGGFHIYLSTDQYLANTCDRLAPFVDTRGEGGYVVAPPSRNRNGVYRWENREPVIAVPDAVLLALKSLHVVTDHFQPEREKEHENSPATHTPVPQVQQTRADAPEAAAQAEPLREARNTYLTSMAGRLRGAGLSAGEICALLTTLNEKRYGSGRHEQGPLALDELERTIFKSVVRWEAECGLRANTLPEINDLRDLMGCVLPEPNWLVPGLLCEGLVLFAGKPKMGKSWLALSLALACARRDDQQEYLALGYYPTRKGGVLYLSLEDSMSRFHSRVNKLLNGRPVPSNFGYALNWKPLMSGGLYDLETILSATADTRLVIIDTLARVRTSGNSSGNIYQEDYALMSALRDLVARHHLVLILVHHTRKMASDDAFDEISGTTGLTGAVDTSLVLKRARGEKDATLHITGRDVEEQELALTFDPAACTWAVTGKAADRQQSQSRQAILDLLAEYGTMAQKEIVQALDVPKGTIYSALPRLVQEGRIRKVGRGRYSLPTEKAQIPLKEKTEAPAQPVDVTEVQVSQPSDDPDSDEGSSAADSGWPEYDDTDREEDNTEEYDWPAYDDPEDETGWPEHDDSESLRDEEDDWR